MNVSIRYTWASLTPLCETNLLVILHFARSLLFTKRWVQKTEFPWGYRKVVAISSSPRRLLLRFYMLLCLKTDSNCSPLFPVLLGVCASRAESSSYAFGVRNKFILPC